MISVDLYLKGHGKSLDQFTYSDSDINRIILSCMANTSIDGISGSLHFEQGADPTKDVKIQRIEGENLEIQINYNNYSGINELRRSAANDNLFKLFFLHLFFTSKIYTKTFKTKIGIG